MTQISDVYLGDALGERYLSYALSTIMSRSLPDVRDGLKPVHRRLLYAMLQLKLDPESGFKKCARVVGDVIGKYHPHGDAAVYQTMVRLAQNFAVRYPLVDGQGNFGSIDGDNAAAMRYTEARLTAVALALLEHVHEDTVDFRPTYDGSDNEPVVLPGAFPNLLANGSEGIAVGMATSIPPHNADELCDALLYLLKHPNASTEKLVEFIPGPDFPTGGVIVEPKASIISTYETGKGAFRVRAKWEKEDLGRGQYNIIITEIPYQVQKAKVIEKIADLLKAKKLSLIDHIRDESDENIRIIIEPKSRSADPELLMESLFRLTELEVKCSLNMNVLHHNTPQVLPLREVLNAFLEHRIDVLIRQSRYRLERIDHRLEVLEGLLVAYLNLDEVIRIIREEDEPKKVMQERWELTDVQVEAILNMRLRSLRKLEEVEIRKEYEGLLEEKEYLEQLLNDETARKKVITEQLKDIKKRFGKQTELGDRRTQFEEAKTATVVSIEAFIEKEPITILCSEKGWIKALKGHQHDLSTVKYKDGDKGRFVLKAYTTDKLMLFSSDGKCFTIGCNTITGGKGHGEPVNLLVDMEDQSQVISLFIYNETQQYLVVSRSGKGFLVPCKDMLAQTKNGKQVLNIGKSDSALACIAAEGDRVAVIGQNRKLLIFDIAELPTMKRGQGVILQRYKHGGISDIQVFKAEDGLSWQLGSRMRVENDLTAWFNKRGNAGKLPPSGFPRNNLFGHRS